MEDWSVHALRHIHMELTHTHTHTHTRARAHTHTHTHTHTCTHVHTHPPTHTHTHPPTHTHTRANTHTREHTHTCAHTCTDTHTYTQIARTHTHTRTHYTNNTSSVTLSFANWVRSSDLSWSDDRTQFGKLKVTEEVLKPCYCVTELCIRVLSTILVDCGPKLLAHTYYVDSFTKLLIYTLAAQKLATTQHSWTV